MLKSQLKAEEVRGVSTTIPLHPCRGCIYRNYCDSTLDMEQGDYCRYKEVKLVKVGTAYYQEVK